MLLCSDGKHSFMFKAQKKTFSGVLRANIEQVTKLADVRHTPDVTASLCDSSCSAVSLLFGELRRIKVNSLISLLSAEVKAELRG